ncbi:MAG: YihY/virulence factor BrkB family protein [Phormidesmis sp.]
MKLSSFLSIFQQTIAEWQRDKVSRLAAALAYYTTFSLAPILVIVIAVASFLFEQSTVQSRLIEQMQDLLGENAAGLIQDMLTSRTQSNDGVWATLISVGLLIAGASGLFIQLQDALYTVWNVVPKKEKKTKRMLLSLLRDRLLSFGMVLAIGFLLIVSLVFSAGLTAVSDSFGDVLLGWDAGWQLLNAAISFGIITLLFALIYKVLPDVKIDWSDVWVGAAMTSLLFTLGKYLIGLYLGNSSVASAYGAAGSFVVLLLWIYYSAQILLFGAEFTQVYARRFGTAIRPDDHAEFTSNAHSLKLEDNNQLPQTRSE